MTPILSIVIKEEVAIFLLIVIGLIIYSIYSKLKDSTETQKNSSERIRTMTEEQRVERLRAENQLKEFQTALENKIQQEVELRLHLKSEHDLIISEKEARLNEREAKIKIDYKDWALSELKRYKETELERMRWDIEMQSKNEAKLMLDKWKMEVEGSIRLDALKRSDSVNLGKAAELLTPFHQNFMSQFNPRDASFLGNPVDYIVFDGYTEGRENLTIYLVEVKTGTSQLTPMQKRIRDAVYNRRIDWREIHYDIISPSTNKDLALNKSALKFNFDQGVGHNHTSEKNLYGSEKKPLPENILGLLSVKIYLKAYTEVSSRVAISLKQGLDFSEAFEAALSQLSLSFPNEQVKLQFKKKVLKNV